MVDSRSYLYILGGYRREKRLLKLLLSQSKGRGEVLPILSKRDRLLLKIC